MPQSRDTTHTPHVSPSKRRDSPRTPRDTHPYRRPQEGWSNSVAQSDEEEFIQVRRGGKVTTYRSSEFFNRRPSEKSPESRSRTTVDPQTNSSTPSLPPNQECSEVYSQAPATPQKKAMPTTYYKQPTPPPAPADPRTAYNGMRMEQLRMLAKLDPSHKPTAAEKAELSQGDGKEATKQ